MTLDALISALSRLRQEQLAGDGSITVMIHSDKGGFNQINHASIQELSSQTKCVISSVRSVASDDDSIIGNG